MRAGNEQAPAEGAGLVQVSHSPDYGTISLVVPGLVTMIVPPRLH